MYDDPLPKLYLVRNRETGLYWRSTKRRSRKPWTDDPAMAWKTKQAISQVKRQFEGHFPKGQVPEYDVVVFEMSYAGPAWDKDHDQEAECECGHTYYRHFDTYEDMRGVGCKYCGCQIFRAKKKGHDLPQSG